MQLEIVICTHNRAALLTRTLESLNGATRPNGYNVGVLVIANACNDDTVQVLRSYQEQASRRGWLPLRWVEEPAPGKSNALNRAIALMSASLVTFVDDDHRVDERYLLELWRATEQEPAATMYCGRILPDWDGREPAWAHDGGPYAIYPLPVPRYDQGKAVKQIGSEDPLPGGGNLIVRRAVFERVGGFSIELGPRGHNLGGGEDSDFVARALSAGERLRYAPAVVQYHYVDPERFRLHYLLQKGFQRTRSITRVGLAGRSFPPRYLWRKLLVYGWRAATALYWPETRFYLMRSAAALGEIAAYVMARNGRAN